MNRSILGIGAFILTFGVSFSLVGLLFGFPKLDLDHSHHSPHAASKIMRVLDRDIYYGEKRRNDSIRLILRNESKGISKTESQISPEFIEIADRYVESSSAINASGTPADFAYAWNAHMAAWNAHLRYLKHKSEGKSVGEAGSHDGREISATWYQVLRIADRYGVPMKPRYYR